MDATAHYRNLVGLGRAEFLASAAPAALVRHQAGAADLDVGAETVEHTRPHSKDLELGGDDADLVVYPLTKKPGASFPDRITIGRTPNNDIVIVDHSVSRFHAYLRLAGKDWVVADAGSKNGSWLGSTTLEARKERTLTSKAIVRLGDVDLTFYVAPDLYAALGGLR
ncbi:MAG: FHA domain-containing protein [Deltaproteobacteria bacterium]|nr:FHA domain-containing protein [Deltaproteobacteria bacterium]